MNAPKPTRRPAHVPVLFLSGAGLPAWIWDDVRADLPAGTNTAVARYPRETHASLGEYADAVAAQVPWSSFAVVAHSIGGVVATELMARHPGRVAGILGVSALIPQPGHSFVRSMPFPARLFLGAMLRFGGTRPPAKAIRTGLAGGLPPAVADRIVADFDPESVRLYRDPAPARQLPAARAYLFTRNDKEFTAAIQRQSAETLEATTTEELPTGHLPMIEDPAAVSHAVQKLLATIVT
ncbi:alpha/beta fold hydrolase [Micromonospora marina]|uniref:alpha/beta fold hydrolase n=1 Tax=Micromonospora marina TaxID=307120 RepID=UPI003453BB62